MLPEGLSYLRHPREFRCIRLLVHTSTLVLPWSTYICPPRRTRPPTHLDQPQNQVPGPRRQSRGLPSETPGGVIVPINGSAGDRRFLSGIRSNPFPSFRMRKKKKNAPILASRLSPSTPGGDKRATETGRQDSPVSSAHSIAYLGDRGTHAVAERPRPSSSINVQRPVPRPFTVPARGKKPSGSFQGSVAPGALGAPSSLVVTHQQGTAGGPLTSIGRQGTGAIPGEPFERVRRGGPTLPNHPISA